MNNRIEESKSAALLEDANEDYFNRNLSNKQKNDQVSIVIDQKE